MTNDFKLSIIIPTYNNAETILGTLNSIIALRQTNRLELVISDDASTDKTMDLVGSWLKTNGSKFWKVKAIPNEVNSGITANHIRAFEAAECEYGLYSGGDDLFFNQDLIPCIEQALRREPSTKIAKLHVEALYIPGNQVEDLYSRLGLFFRMSARRQFTAMALFRNFLYAGPGTLVNIPTLRRIKAFDPSIKTFEDYPLFLNFLLSRHKIHFFDIKGIYWVRSRHSLSARGFGSLKPQFDRELIMIEDKYVSPNLARMAFPGKLVWFLRKYPKLFRIAKRLSTAILGFPN